MSVVRDSLGRPWTIVACHDLARRLKSIGLDLRRAMRDGGAIVECIGDVRHRERAIDALWLLSPLDRLVLGVTRGAGPNQPGPPPDDGSASGE